jgi:hypothetical protein
LRRNSCSPDDGNGLDYKIGRCRVGRHRSALFIHVFQVADRVAAGAYHSFQIALSRWIGSDVPAIVPWLLSFLNGMTLIGLLFGRIVWLLPGRSGAAKGLSFGFIGWASLNLIFFPLIDLGPFAVRVGAGIGPALLSLGMLLTYSIVLGAVYVALGERVDERPLKRGRSFERDY